MLLMLFQIKLLFCNTSIPRFYIYIFYHYLLISSFHYISLLFNYMFSLTILSEDPELGIWGLWFFG